MRRKNRFNKFNLLVKRYFITGLLVPESEIIPLSMSVEDGMKMIISGGL